MVRTHALCWHSPHLDRGWCCTIRTTAEASKVQTVIDTAISVAPVCREHRADVLCGGCGWYGKTARVIAAVLSEICHEASEPTTRNSRPTTRLVSSLGRTLRAARASAPGMTNGNAPSHK